MNTTETLRQLKGWTLTTAEILYRLPDHRNLVNVFIWQRLDLAPNFPELQSFLKFWRREIEGPIVQVRVSSAGLLAPSRAHFVDYDFALH